MLTPGPRAVAAVVLMAALTSALSTTTAPSEPTLYPNDPCAANPCFNNSTCRVEEDWEFSGDLGLGDFLCQCQPEFSGNRCEEKMNTSSCEREGEFCQPNGRCLCREDRCSCVEDSREPPTCTNETVTVTFDIEKWSPQPIICFDMYYTNASSHCYDSGNTLVFNITREQTTNLFCLIINYQTWQTCLQVNNTFRSNLAPSQPSEKVTLAATEWPDGRSDTLEVEVVFNRAPQANKALDTYLLNSAQLRHRPARLNLLQDAQIRDLDGHNMSFSIYNNNGTPPHVKLTIDETTGVLQASTLRDDLNESSFSVTVEITDDGTPSQQTRLDVPIRLLFLRCHEPSRLYLDASRLPTPAPGPLVFRQSCIVTPGYLTRLSVAPAGNHATTLRKYRVFPENGTLHVFGDDKGHYSVNLTIALNESVEQTWSAQLLVSHYKTITFAVANATWREALADPSSADFGNVSSGVEQRIRRDIGMSTFDVVQFRNDSGLTVEGLLYTQDDTVLQRDAARLLRYLRSKNASEVLAVKNNTVKLYDRAGFLALDARPLERRGVSLTWRFPDNGTDYNATCIVTGMTFGDDVIFEWRMHGSVVRPTSSSRLKIETSGEPQAWLPTFRSTLVASPIFYRDMGDLTCLARTKTNEIKANRTHELGVMTTPRVKLEPIGTSYIKCGNPLTVTCTVLSSYPPPFNLTLFDDTGKILRTTGDGTKTVTYDLPTNTTRRDIKCSAINTVGQSEPDNITVFTFARPCSAPVPTCPASTDGRGLGWRETPTKRTVVQSCPRGYTGTASRHCHENGSFGAPDYSQCVRLEFLALERQVENLEDGKLVTSVLNASRNMTSLTSPDVQPLTAAELDTVTSLLNRLAKIIKEQEMSTEDVTNTTKEFLKITNNVMNSTNDEGWGQLEKLTNTTPVDVMSALDGVSEQLAQSLSNSNISLSEGFLTLQAGTVHTITMGSIIFPSTAQGKGTSLVISQDTLRTIMATGESQVVYSALIYTGIGRVLPGVTSDSVRRNRTQRFINSDILAMNLFSHPNATASPLITMTFFHQNTSYIDPVCGYWNTTTSLWDDNGCQVTRQLEDRTECQCDHLTNFALLMAPTAQATHFILSVITWVGVVISLACLALTLATYAAVWRYVRSDRAALLVNLCIALILAYVTFLAGVSQTQIQAVCTAVAVLLHYFFLAAFFLMLAEGLEVLITMVTVFSTKSKRGKLLVIGWGTPLVIVAISMASTQLHGYGDQNSCWLSPANGLLWAFVVPALIVIVANFCIIIKILHTMLNTRSMISKPLQIKARAALRSLCVLVPVLGITWIMGVLAVNEQTVVFQYIFTVCNSLQGFFIFIFHCALNNKVREGLGHSVRKFQSRRSMHTSNRSSKSPTHQNNGDQSTPPRRESGSSPHLPRLALFPMTPGLKGPIFSHPGSDSSNRSSDKASLNPAFFRPAIRRQDELTARRSSLGVVAPMVQGSENGHTGGGGHLQAPGERWQVRHRSRYSPGASRTSKTSSQPRRDSRGEHWYHAPFHSTFTNNAFEDDEGVYMQTVAERVLSSDLEPDVIFGSRGSGLDATAEPSHGRPAIGGGEHRKVLKYLPGSDHQTHNAGSEFHHQSRTPNPASEFGRGVRGGDVGREHRWDDSDVMSQASSIRLPRVTLR